ncbi:DUF5605 domain-containing protein [Microbacterium sp. JZ70]
MRHITRRTPLATVLDHPDTRDVVARIAPDVLDAPLLKDLVGFPTGPILGLVLGAEDPRVTAILEELAAFEDRSERPADGRQVVPADDYESATTARASAGARVAESAAPGAVELVFDGPSHGNPFVEVELAVEFRREGTSVRVGGFYDGDGTYRARFLPPAPGTWTFATHSTSRSLDGIEGEVSAEADGSHGPVHVDGLHFAHRDGTPFAPVGTTAYVWTLQDDELQERTLGSLAQAPFNKVRMGLFPKDFLYNSNEPDRYPFARADGGWDPERFDVAYFQHLELRIAQLADLGIEADLILFHPYDRWGFSRMGEVIDDRYVSYVVRRLAAFRNVWWSLANEYDLLTTKDDADWNRLGELVAAEDHVGHPRSIHNWIDIFDYSAGWATHASIQGGGYRMGELVASWRTRWHKPVIVDEFGYEGDLDQGWGNLTAEEVVRRFWEGTVRGGYLSHGETFYADDEVIFWAKGGDLRGESIPRLAFLREIVAQSPTGRIDPLPSDWDAAWGGVPDEYILISFGGARPRFRDVLIPDGMTARIDVIDTWNMTIDPVPGEHSGRTRVQLPAKPFIAVRLTRA